VCALGPEVKERVTKLHLSGLSVRGIARAVPEVPTKDVLYEHIKHVDDPEAEMQQELWAVLYAAKRVLPYHPAAANAMAADMDANGFRDLADAFQYLARKNSVASSGVRAGGSVSTPGPNACNQEAETA
jgi:hypothetical protein